MSNKPTNEGTENEAVVPSAVSAVNDPATSEPVAPVPEPLRILGRDEILDSEDLATETVPVPEWGGAVIVRALTGTERDAYESEIFSLRGQGGGIEYNLQNIRAKLSARTIVDTDGKRLFTDADIIKLGLKSAAALDRVFSAAQRLSRLTAQDVKELTAQLGNGPSDDSGSV